ncbi:hypothetical protein M427DRAFT_377838 [Gonapodya prolifera JEL478]|uniref:Uncharacterized protein n=1 Tax=Gonapodya prolifera (strain JEL478) TaxID=1344416 RepID=A0A139AUX9_GONPJ|nr:hypothetical protein M427DRAFT_377838 [Gonapodya prolifera JEL478]|eukprot:KXS20540.1 hypothetical protein M427DRAFT_377838 [Gonapodya prolifera JEL478]
MNAGNMCDSCLSTRMDPTLPKDGGTVTAMTVVNGLQNAFIVLMCLNVGVLHCVVTHFVQHLSGTGSGGTSSQNRSYSKPLSGLRSQGSALTFETAPTSGRRTPRGKSELRDAPIFDQNDDISMFTSTQSGKSIERPAASDKKSSPHGDNGYPEDSHGSQYGVAGNAQRKLILGSSLASSSGGGSTSAPAPAPAVQTGFSPNALLGGSERVSTLERRRVSVDIGQVQMAVGTGPLGASTLERRRGAGNTLRRMSLVSEAIAREAATEMGANPNGDMGGGNGTGNSSVSVRSRSVSATKPLKEVDGTKGSLG